MAKTARPAIPEKVKYILWGKSAGRCQLCNKPVYEDYLTHEELNLAEHAHIIANSADGPRGDENLSEEYATDLANLMLLCREHHKKIDTEEYVEKYPPSLLRDIKKRHEERIELATAISEEQQSHVLLYSANISSQTNPVNYTGAVQAMFPLRYPAERQPITIHLTGNPANDSQAKFWETEVDNLNHHFTTRIKPRIDRQEIKHVSVFGLAPIPLLIHLGTLLTDKTPADVYQLHREPAGWRWVDDYAPDFNYTVTAPADFSPTKVALAISFSGSIGQQDILSAVGTDAAVWQMAINAPHNDFMQAKEQLSLFRKAFRRLLNTIKDKHGKDAEIHICPAVPVSVAIEIGRVWMPKADLPLIIYDRNRQNLQFERAFKVG